MRTLFFLSLLFFGSIATAQLFNIDHLAATDVGFVRVAAGDFDQDGDQDLLTITSQLMVWYPNLDGLGNFGEPITLDTGMGQSFNQAVADLDGDGREDLLISYFDQDFIAYYRNLGNGTFAPFQVLASGLNRASGIAPGDLDGDGDLDLVLGVSNGSGFYWIEQLTNGSFGPLIPISTTLSQARNQKLGDIDGDGDLDILTNSVGNTLLSWFENVNGLGDFSQQHSIETNGLYENFFQLADLDGDGDLDNLSIKNDEILWRDNLDGLGNFGTAQNLFTTSNGTPMGNIQAADLDNDTDLDIVFDVGYDFGKVYLLNIDGQGTFGPANFIDPPEGGSAGNNLPVDVDGDGDFDLINSSLFFSDNHIDLYWYENLTILGNEDFKDESTVIYPNPTKDILFINSPNAINIVSIYDVLGRKLLQKEENINQLDVSSLPNGILFIELETEMAKVVKKLVKE